MAVRPERDDRPSARDLGLALLASAGSLPRPAPLPLPKAGPEISDTAETAAVGASSSRSEAASAPPDAVRPGFRRLLVALVALVLLGAAGFGVFALWERQFGTESQPVPDLSGADEAELLRIESEFGWVLNRLDQRQDGTAAGQVLRQEPQPGAELEEGGTVTVWVSLGPELVAIPSNLAGLAVQDAEISLDAVGLSVGEITQRPDETVIAGAVIEVDELFTEVEPGSSVDLVVSLGPLPRVVPDIEAGSSLAVARERLEQVRLEVLESRVSDNVVQVDHVVRLEPPPGTEVAADSIITVVVSTGPEQVRVPFLATLGVGDAVNVLEQADLCLGEVEGPLDSEILASNPPADTVVDFGMCVDLFTRPDEEDGESSG